MTIRKWCLVISGAMAIGTVACSIFGELYQSIGMLSLGAQVGSWAAVLLFLEVLTRPPA